MQTTLLKYLRERYRIIPSNFSGDLRYFDNQTKDFEYIHGGLLTSFVIDVYSEFVKYDFFERLFYKACQIRRTRKKRIRGKNICDFQTALAAQRVNRYVSENKKRKEIGLDPIQFQTFLGTP